MGNFLVRILFLLLIIGPYTLSLHKNKIIKINTKNKKFNNSSQYTFKDVRLHFKQKK